MIGFRNPIPGRKALLVSLENPQAVIDGKEKPKLGQPILLDLGGLGIRSIEYSDAKKTYFIIAGPYDNNDGFQLYQWSGKPSEAPGLINGIDFQGLHPETLVVYPEEMTGIQILSDDGRKKRTGKSAKNWIPKISVSAACGSAGNLDEIFFPYACSEQRWKKDCLVIAVRPANLALPADVNCPKDDNSQDYKIDIHIRRITKGLVQPFQNTTKLNFCCLFIAVW